MRFASARDEAANRGVWVQIRRLRQHANSRTARAGHPARIRFDQAGHDPQESRLSAAVAPDDTNAIADLDAKRDVGQYRILAIGLRDFFQVHKIAGCHTVTLSDAVGQPACGVGI